jgi:hypothetical protein
VSSVQPGTFIVSKSINNMEERNIAYCLCSSEKLEFFFASSLGISLILMIYNTLLAEISIIFSVLVLVVSETHCLMNESKVIKILILCCSTNILFQCHLFYLFLKLIACNKRS